MHCALPVCAHLCAPFHVSFHIFEFCVYRCVAEVFQRGFVCFFLEKRIFFRTGDFFFRKENFEDFF